MKDFFKIFLASLVALFVFSIISFAISFIMMAALSSMAMQSEGKINDNSVLVVDLNNALAEQTKESMSMGFQFSTSKTMGLYDVIRMIEHAKTDKKIKGIYIKAGGNANGFATSRELRNALQDFKTSKKFVVAYSLYIPQKAYYVASVADKVYIHPQGGLDFRGLTSQTMFFKGTLDKLQVEPHIFFAGKYKSATEPFRVTKMTEANKEQTAAWLNDLNDVMLTDIAVSRKIDTATLRGIANNFTVQMPDDAVTHKMIDGLKYNDEIQTEMRKLLSLKEKDKLNLVSLENYSKSSAYKKSKSAAKGDEIAIVFAEGNIMPDGNEEEMITSKQFVDIFRKIRLDDDIKAVVFRVNSPGGSALASDEIWREIELTKKKKPVVVSMGDMAASGGYYISCAANKIYADPNTLTGSIGVFSMMANLDNFFKSKLGVTFDGVKTGPYADMGSVFRDMSEGEKRYFQMMVDTIYNTFKSRVATGRSRSIEYIDSIAQGHVWSGTDAKTIGLVDELGSLKDAIKYTAGLIKASDYQLKEYPARKDLFAQLLSMSKSDDTDIQKEMIKKEFGVEAVNMYRQMNTFRMMMNSPQALLPYNIDVR